MLCLRKINTAFVNRTAGNRTGYTVFLGGTQGAYVVQVGQTAGSNNGNADCFGQLNRCIDVYPAHHAVAADIGVDNAVYSVVGKASAQIGRAVFGYRCSAVDSHHSVFGIDTDDNMSGKLPAGLAHESRIFNCRRTDNNVCQS